MNRGSELVMFSGTEDAREIFYPYDYIRTKSLTESEKTEKILAYLTGIEFDFYFDRFTLGNAPLKRLQTTR